MAGDLSEERRTILRMLQEGRITPEQAVELLKALGAAGAGEEGRARPAPGEVGEPGERGDLLRWAEQLGNRVAEMADELAERVQRVVASAGVSERVGDVGERVLEAGERLQELSRAVTDRVGQVFGQLSTVAFPAFTFTEELAGQFEGEARPQIDLVTRSGSVTVRTDPAQGPGAWRLLVRKVVRARHREEAESAGARLLSLSHGPAYLTLRSEGWLQGSADLELVLPVGLQVNLRAEAGSGSVSVQGVRGGTVEARSLNGRVDLADVAAQRLWARTTNGTLLLEGVLADLVEVYSVNGSVTASAAGAEVRLNSFNGSVTVRPEAWPEGPPHRRLEAHATSAVRVLLPAALREAAQREELGLYLEATSHGGPARIEVPGTILVNQGGQAGRQRVVSQSPHFERAGRTLRVMAEARTGSATVAAD